ncbi:AfsR/SARP family transcriptional regulator [Micromonospora vulcania]|uniref:BTAD domain-containing putative transcriptional regulator n=1 Tax=Micromonospora vulcania TaxID=1441873 RepID=A0ABW1H4X2_9ACTN
MLVANVNRGVSVDRLVDAVWEADPPATAREQVQNCVSMLRRSLDNGANDATINRSGRGYQLDADPYEIDAHCFERDLHSAAEHLDENRPEAAAAVLHGALALWTGPALDGLDAVELRAHALRLDELRATATERLIQTKIRLGRLDDAVADLRRLTGLHPTDERYMLLLVDALLLGRRPPEALASYRAFARRLADDLGSQPGPSAHAVERRIQLALQGTEPAAGTPSAHARTDSDLSAFAGMRGSVTVATRQDSELQRHLDEAISHIRAVYLLLNDGR